MTRRPQAFSPDDVRIERMSPPEDVAAPDAADDAAGLDGATVAGPGGAAPAPSRRLAAVFISAAGGLVTLAVGLWLADLVTAAFARFAALGWIAAGLVAVAVAAGGAALAGEWLALRRLKRVEAIRHAAEAALEAGSDRLAAAAAARFEALAAANPRAARGRSAYRAAVAGAIVDGRDRLRILEREILEPLDREAVGLVAAAARRVSVTTALSPRAAIDVVVVVWTAFRLVRRLGDLYGGRPGGLAEWRLLRRVAVQVLVSGGMAAGDEVVGQLLGQGLAARLSARLGEGMVNGLMTARLGLAALMLTRPLPFIGAPRPDLKDVTGDLVGRR
jgi:putative membrane protein